MSLECDEQGWEDLQYLANRSYLLLERNAYIAEVLRFVSKCWGQEREMITQERLRGLLLGLGVLVRRVAEDPSSSAEHRAEYVVVKDKVRTANFIPSFCVCSPSRSSSHHWRVLVRTIASGPHMTNPATYLHNFSSPSLESLGFHSSCSCAA